jgi:hypothetical protein
MPFKSEDQRGYMWEHHPDIAKRWEKITDDSKLPKRMSDGGDNSSFDPHQTDPRKLRMEALSHMGLITRERVIPNYKGHRIEIWNDFRKGTQYHIEGPRFNTPTQQAHSIYDAEVRAKGLLDQVIR